MATMFPPELLLAYAAAVLLVARVVAAVNVGASLVFVAAGLSVLALEHRK